MNMTTEELKNVLETIKHECLMTADCAECSLGTVSGKCLITASEPYEWKIRDKVEVVRVMED